MHAAPEGLIDPWLRTVTFFDGATPLVRMHYYASHLQNNYGDGLADPDVAGFARARLEKEEGIPHLYFAGCGGDICIGKYNVHPPGELRQDLTQRLVTAMKEAAASTGREPVEAVCWDVVGVRFAPRTEEEFSEASFRRQIEDSREKAEKRLKAALGLAWIERLKARPECELSRLRLGSVSIVHLPGECFIEYQLYAQGLRPDEFVAVAANGEGGPGYICTDRAFREGGYETTMALVGPPSESRLKAALAELLTGGKRP